MKQFFKVFLACLCAILVFIGIIIFAFAGLAIGSTADEKTEVESKSVLYLDANTLYAEQSSENSFAVLSGEEAYTEGLNELLRSIRFAKTDKNIEGIYIRLGMNDNGWATLQELREALLDFKASKKFVIAYGEFTNQKSYYLATAADKVYLNPVGAIQFLGLSITGTFYKGTLDKLDVKPEAFHCGKYKGAYEPYKLDKFSEPNREQLSVLLHDLNSNFLQAVSQKTSIDTASLASLSSTGAIKFPIDAVNNRLLDGLLYSDSVESIIKSKIKLDEKDKINFVSTADYASAVTKNTKAKDKIAILYAEGAIYDGENHEEIYSKNYVKHIRKIAKDDRIKAVVLRINSPGGSALASEVLYHELMRLKKKKPLIISMGNYATSGGYYLACAGDKIYADDNTLTGSIGVVGVLFNIGDMLKNKLGVTRDVIKTGSYSDFPNLTRPMSDGERAWIQSYLDSTYKMFKSRVAIARNMNMEQVETLAQGHVYSGLMAKKLGLIDELGNTDDALKAAAAKASLKEFSLVEYPKPIDPFNEILSSMSGKKREEAIVKKILGSEFGMYEQIRNLRSHTSSIQAVLPWIIDIK